MHFSYRNAVSNERYLAGHGHNGVLFLKKICMIKWHDNACFICFYSTSLSKCCQLLTSLHLLQIR